MYEWIKRLFRKKTPDEQALRAAAECDYKNKHSHFWPSGGLEWLYMSVVIMLAVVILVFLVPVIYHQTTTTTFISADGQRWVEKVHNGDTYLNGVKVHTSTHISFGWSLDWLIGTGVAFVIWGVVGFVVAYQRKNRYIREFTKTHTVSIKAV